MIKLKSAEDIANWQAKNGQAGNGLPVVFYNSTISLNGAGTVLKFGTNTKFANCNITIDADDGTLEVGSDCEVRIGFRVGHKSTITVGDRFYSTGGGTISACESTKLKIGNDCMFAVMVDIRTDHSHPIFDRKTGARINLSEDLTIEDHVWLGPYARVYPGSRIGEGSVIGAGSLVNACVPPNSVAVGTPVRVVRKNVVWHRTHVGIKRPWKFGNISEIEGAWHSQLPLDEDTESAPRKETKVISRSAIIGLAAGAFGSFLYELVSVLIGLVA